MAAGALLLGTLVASCSREEGVSPDGFPEGGRPATFTAEVKAAVTRSTADGMWTGGESIAVAVGGDVKIYTAASGGLLTSADPFMWTSTSETKQVQAWYCGDGSSAADGANASAVPTSWNVAEDQSGEGYGRSDLLVAPSTELTYAGPHALTFYHRTAKVVVNIRRSTDSPVGSAADIASISIGSANMALSGTYDDASGEWTPGTADGTIAPRGIAASGDDFAASYDALVIPQTMDGKELIVVTLNDGQRFCYTPGEGDAQFVSGALHAYNITVYGDRIEVDVVTGGNWTEGSSTSVTSKATFLPDRLKPGDYYYSDGTWSDGGLRGIASDGTLEVAEPKPAPVAGKRVIGLIAVLYSEHPSVFAQAEKDALAQAGGSEPTAMVIATKDAGTAAWADSEYGSTDTPITNCTIETEVNDLSGLGNGNLLKETYSDPELSHFPAFKIAAGYTETVPEKTTGWFLPSVGQWHYINHGLGGSEYMGATKMIEWYNYWTSEVAEDQKTNMEAVAIRACYWSASELDASNAFTWASSGGHIVPYYNTKRSWYYPVRSMLVF